MKQVDLVDQVDEYWSSGVQAAPLCRRVKIRLWLENSPQPVDGDQATKRWEMLLDCHCVAIEASMVAYKQSSLAIFGASDLQVLAD